MSRRQRKPVGDLRELLGKLGPLPPMPSIDDEELIEATAAARVTWHRMRARIVETHRKRSRLSDPEFCQERHSPTVEIAVDDPEAKRKTRRNITRVRQSEAWRHNQLNAMQRQAESEMNMSWRLRTNGLGIASISLVRVPGGAVVMLTPERYAHIEEFWREFASEMRRRRWRLALVIETLCEPYTLREIEHRARLPIGSAMVIYERALDLWCQLRGWMRPPISVHQSRPAHSARDGARASASAP